MKLLLVNPTIYDCRGELIKQKRVWLPGLTLPYLAALTPEDVEVRIVDEVTCDVPFDGDWDLVGISSFGSGITRTWEIGDAFRAKGIPVVIGGVSATLGGVERSKPHCDSIVLGEAENVWLKLLTDLAEKRLESVYDGGLADIKNIPVPRYDLLDRSKIGFWLPVQATRGCRNVCSFCSVASFYGSTYRDRPVEQVVRDVEEIKRLGFKRITLIDDNIGLDRAYLGRLCRELAGLKIQWMSQCSIDIADDEEALGLMAESGCAMLSMGLESVNQGSLDSVRKKFSRVKNYLESIRKIRSYGIDVSTEMMVGLDSDSDDVFERLYDFIMEASVSVPRLYIVTPIPGTPLFDEMERAGRITDRDFAHYNGARLVFKPAGMTAETMEQSYWKLYERLFGFGNIASRILRSRPTRGWLVNLFLIGANLHYVRHIGKRIPPGIV